MVEKSVLFTNENEQLSSSFVSTIEPTLTGYDSMSLVEAFIPLRSKDEKTIYMIDQTKLREKYQFPVKISCKIPDVNAVFDYNINKLVIIQFEMLKNETFLEKKDTNISSYIRSQSRHSFDLPHHKINHVGETNLDMLRSKPCENTFYVVNDGVRLELTFKIYLNSKHPKAVNYYRNTDKIPYFSLYGMITKIQLTLLAEMLVPVPLANIDDNDQLFIYCDEIRPVRIANQFEPVLSAIVFETDEKKKYLHFEQSFPLSIPYQLLSTLNSQFHFKLRNAVDRPNIHVNPDNICLFICKFFPQKQNETTNALLAYSTS